MNLKSIWIETTTRCNLSCEMCGRDKGGEDMSLELFTKIADQCISKADEVNLTGVGESTITKNFYEMCSLVLKKYNKKLIMISNGTQLNRDNGLLELLIQNKTDLVLSIDGIGDTYEKIRRGASWSNLMETIEKIKKMRKHGGSPFRLGINFVLNRENRLELQEIIEKAATEWMVDFICVIIMQPWFANREFYNKAAPVYFKEETNDILDKAKETADKFNMEIFLPEKFNLHKGKKGYSKSAGISVSIMKFSRQIKWLAGKTPLIKIYKYPALFYLKYSKLYRLYYRMAGLPGASCPVPFERLYFNVKGEVAPCCALPNYIVGSMQNQTIEEIQRGRHYLQAIENMNENYLAVECFRCNFPIGVNKGNPDGR